MTVYIRKAPQDDAVRGETHELTRALYELVSQHIAGKPLDDAGSVGISAAANLLVIIIANYIEQHDEVPDAGRIAQALTELPWNRIIHTHARTAEQFEAEKRERDQS